MSEKKKGMSIDIREKKTIPIFSGKDKKSEQKKKKEEDTLSHLATKHLDKINKW